MQPLTALSCPAGTTATHAIPSWVRAPELSYISGCKPLQRTPACVRPKPGSRLIAAAGLFGGLFGGGKESSKTCSRCQAKGAISCPGCKGTGRNRKNGNVFERWKCYDCQGFGQVTCPKCGGGQGLTPEQRRER